MAVCGETPSDQRAQRVSSAEGRGRDVTEVSTNAQEESAVCARKISRLVHCLHASDLGDVVLEVPLNPHLEGHIARGAADAGTVEPNLDGPVLGDTDILNVSAIGLHRRADEAEHALDAFV